MEHYEYIIYCFIRRYFIENKKFCINIHLPMSEVLSFDYIFLLSVEYNIFSIKSPI